MRHEAIKSLLRLAGEDRLPQSILLYGPSAHEVDGAARDFLAALVCSSHRAQVACGECADCRALIAGEHPEILDAGGREAGESAAAIKVDEIRAAIEHLAWHSSVRADRRRAWRVVWLRDAANLTEQAANAFLKTLEEPPAGSLVLVTARHPGSLLPTLRSRLLALRIPGREAVVEFPAEVRAAVRDVIAARGVAAALAPAEKLARQARVRPGDFAACAELTLNGIYREALVAAAEKVTGDLSPLSPALIEEVLVKRSGSRRQTLSQLHQLARRQRIAMNTQLAAEMAGGLRFER